MTALFADIKGWTELERDLDPRTPARCRASLFQHGNLLRVGYFIASGILVILVPPSCEAKALMTNEKW